MKTILSCLAASLTLTSAAVIGADWETEQGIDLAEECRKFAKLEGVPAEQMDDYVAQCAAREEEPPPPPPGAPADQ